MKTPFLSAFYSLVVSTLALLSSFAQNTPTSAEQIEMAAIRSRMLPVQVSYRIGDGCVLVLHNYTNENLALIITATNQTFHEPNTWKIIMTNT